jgi:hypothetical protein
MIVEHVKRKKFKEWKCGGCEHLLGLAYPDGTLAIKYKELVAWVTGEYKTICRYCKVINTYTSTSKFEDFN